MSLKILEIPYGAWEFQNMSQQGTHQLAKTIHLWEREGCLTREKSFNNYENLIFQPSTLLQ